MKAKGFSLIELLVVILLMTLTAFGVMLAYSRLKRNQEIAAVAMQVSQTINSGRVKSIAGEEDSDWKVSWTADHVWLENRQGEKQEDYFLPSRYLLTGPGTELVFSRPDGRVSSCQSGCLLEVKDKNNQQTYQIRILFSGVVEY